MVYYNTIIKEIEKCSTEVNKLEDDISINLDPDKKNIKLMELEHIELYRLSLKKLIHSFSWQFNSEQLVKANQTS